MRGRRTEHTLETWADVGLEFDTDVDMDFDMNIDGAMLGWGRFLCP